MNEYLFVAAISIRASNEDEAHISFKEQWRNHTPKQIFELFALHEVKMEKLIEDDEEDDLPY
jgi:hypothetical protein